MTDWIDLKESMCVFSRDVQEKLEVSVQRDVFTWWWRRQHKLHRIHRSRVLQRESRQVSCFAFVFLHYFSFIKNGSIFSLSHACRIFKKRSSRKSAGSASRSSSRANSVGQLLSGQHIDLVAIESENGQYRLRNLWNWILNERFYAVTLSFFLTPGSQAGRLPFQVSPLDIPQLRSIMTNCSLQTPVQVFDLILFICL